MTFHPDRPSGVRMTSEWSVSDGGTCRIVWDVSIVHSGAVLCSTLTWRITAVQHSVRPIVQLATRCSVETWRGSCFWRMMLEDPIDSAVGLPCVIGMYFRIFFIIWRFCVSVPVSLTGSRQWVHQWASSPVSALNQISLGRCIGNDRHGVPCVVIITETCYENHKYLMD